MKCGKCGKKIEADSDFCRFCGNPVDKSVKEKEKKTLKTGLSLKAADGDDGNFILTFLKEINPLHIGVFVLLLCLLVSVITFAILRPKAKRDKSSDVLGEAENPTAQVVVWDDTKEYGSTEVSTASEEVSSEETEEALYDKEYSEDTGIHKYEIIIKDLKWTEAFQDCINKGGYLLHLNSDEERAHVLEQIKKEGYDSVYFYIGASRNEDSQNYYWVNSDAKHFGKALNNNPDYADQWLYGEPSFQDTDFGTGEYFLDMLNHPDEGKWYFNDISDDGLYSFLKGKKRIGYICEYE